MNFYKEMEAEDKAMAEHKAEELKVENNFNLNNIYAEVDAEIEEESESKINLNNTDEEIRLLMIASHDWSNVKGLI